MSFNFTRPTLITISGPTGSGKSYLQKLLIDNKLVTKACAITTREKRAGEREGIDYNFISHDYAKDLLEKNMLVEHNFYLGNMYGLTKESFLNHAFSNIPLAVIVDPNGVQSYQKICLEQNIDILRVFVQTPQGDITSRLEERYRDEYAAVNRYFSMFTAKNPNAENYDAVAQETSEKLEQVTAKHNARLKNFVLDESRWLIAYNWDVIVHGDRDPEEAIAAIEQAVTVKNRKNQEPVPYEA